MPSPPPPPSPPARSTKDEEFTSVVQEVTTSKHRAPFSHGHVVCCDENNTTRLSLHIRSRSRPLSGRVERLLM